MQHDIKVFQHRARGSRIEDRAGANGLASPIGGGPHAVRGILYGLPIAAALWALIFLSIWMVS